MYKSQTWKGVSAACTLAFTSIVSANAATPAHPGMLNYVEGSASINGSPVTSRQVGSSEVAQGQVLQTTAGKAEILLTPGVFLRLGDNSAVRMDSAGLTHTSLEILQGKALVEATDLKGQNNIQIADRGTIATLEKNGLYSFDADQGTVAVYDGKAQVRENDRTVELKKGRETFSDSLRSEKFDRSGVDDLYNWSNLRSKYLSDESAASARTYLVGGGGGWLGGGWYWNPYFSSYSYLPGDGLLYSPFGYGFYSPFGYRAYYGGGYGGYGYYGGNYRVHSGDRNGNFGRAAGNLRGYGAGNFGSGSNGFGRSSGMSAHTATGGGFGRGAAHR